MYTIVVSCALLSAKHLDTHVQTGNMWLVLLPDSLSKQEEESGTFAFTTICSLVPRQRYIHTWLVYRASFCTSRVLLVGTTRLSSPSTSRRQMPPRGLEGGMVYRRTGKMRYIHWCQKTVLWCSHTVCGVVCIACYNCQLYAYWNFVHVSACPLHLQSAVGWEYQAELSKHESQTDAAKGFGGKYGVQKDRQDEVCISADCYTTCIVLRYSLIQYSVCVAYSWLHC